MDNKVERQIQYFDNVAEKYFNARLSKNYIEFYKLLYDEVFRYMPKFAPGQKIEVLEAMCGSGNGKRLVEEHYRNEVEYTGFDYSQEMIRLTQEKYPEINIYRQDVTTFVADKKYDIVILLAGLHHVPDYIDTILTQLKRSLKPKGVFLNFEPTFNNFFMKMISEHIYKKNDLFDEATERRLGLTELNKSYLAAGFNIKYQLYFGLLGYILWCNPDAFPKLNIGGINLVRKVFTFEKRLFTSLFAKKVSFTTISICGIPEDITTS